MALMEEMDFNSNKEFEKQKKKYQCEICDKSLARKSTLAYHIGIYHTLHKSFKCEFCLKCFAGKDLLLRHKKTHANTKRFDCKICKRCFTQKIHLERHALTHLKKDKPYKCAICSIAVGCKETLNCHMKLHTGEKPYECDICFKKFMWPRSFSRHVDSHTYEYANHLPSDESVEKLDKVIRRKFHEKHFNCETCGKIFASSIFLNQHKKIHNNKHDMHLENVIDSSSELKDACDEKEHFENTKHLENVTSSSSKLKVKCDKEKNFAFNIHFKNVSSSELKVNCGKEENFKCDMCPEAFETFVDLSCHRSTHWKFFSM